VDSIDLPPFHEMFAPTFSRQAALGGLSAGGLGIAAAMTARNRAGASRQEPGASPEASPPGATPAAEGGARVVPDIFAFESFNIESLNVLGGTFERIADISESSAATMSILDYDFDSWVASWVALGDRLNAIGDIADGAGRSARTSRSGWR
jgi:hypothetical protein